MSSLQLLASRDKRSFTHTEKTDLQNHTVMVFLGGGGGGGICMVGGGVEVNVCRIIFSVSTDILEKLPPFYVRFVLCCYLPVGKQARHPSE